MVGDQKSGEDIQLPSTVTQLGTSLANVKMANLVRKEAAFSIQTGRTLNDPMRIQRITVECGRWVVQGWQNGVRGE